MVKPGPKPKPPSEVRSHQTLVRMREDSGRLMEEMAAKYGLKPAQFIRRVLYDLVNPGGPDLSKDWVVRLERNPAHHSRKNADTPDVVRPQWFLKEEEFGGKTPDLRIIPDSQVRGAVERVQGLDGGEEFAF